MSRLSPWLRKVGALVAVGALLASATVAVGSLVWPTAAQAEGTDDGALTLASDNTFYAYLEDGDTLDASFLVSSKGGAVGTPHHYVVTDPQGTVAWQCDLPADTPVGEGCTSPTLTGAAGVWTVEDTQSAGSSITRLDWSLDVTAADGSARPGRVWAYRPFFSQNTGESPDVDVWLVNDTGYQYQVALEDYNGFQSTIQANATGVSDLNCVPTYQSTEADATGRGAPTDPNLTADCEPQFRVFFAPPAADLPASAQSADGTVTVAPPVLTSADLTVEDLAFAPTATGGAAGTFSYSITERFSGGYQLQVDTDGNGSYDDAVDRTVNLGADGSGSYTYEFDGLDGQGDPIEDCVQMNARIYFPTVGEIHILQYDVEQRAGGIEVTALNGEAAGNQTIYWDDTDLADDRANTTPQTDGTAGVDSAGGVHGWEAGGNSWGNERIIDDWTFTPLEYGTGELAVGGRCLALEKTSDADEDTRVGDTVTYTVTATNTGDTDYTDAEPATVTDDLSGVLDDATYDGDATSDVDGELTYDEPKLSWTGALPAGESVTLTYTTTVTGAGDGSVRNVAYGGSPDDETPACDPPTDAGSDPDTGVPCAETEALLPSLSVTKSADTDTVSAVGQTVTYTVTATNDGPGVYTETAPATVVDDLGGVLDDATVDAGSLTTSTGADAVLSGDRVTWSGALGVGESVTITYEVTYTGAGDALLRNVAFAPSDPSDPTTPACDPADEDGRDPDTGEPCALVEVPAGQLAVTKSVDPRTARRSRPARS
ncbi:DUF11 domain-containing protein [Phycicoccus endophyticus]|uniref:DUF11 domain-containing protein n=1 Tax=Phycicoccus endophyticus TaxID=1690220 RepID=A0A7G9R1L1_9MICO|nr:DUF11 domain-containing protein [Phycicoccus endophyticus]QNN49486.1 DUF11 domain-containing protein [Phycicoccus endophyticus]